MAEVVDSSWKNVPPRSGTVHVVWSDQALHSTTTDLYPTNSNDSAIYRDVFRNKAPEFAKALPTDEDHVRTGTEFDPVEEKGPWRTSTLLSLDGGGVRGLSSLLILQNLMREIEKLEKKHTSPATSSADSPMIEAERINEEFEKFKKQSKDPSRFLPCHYFDYIAGTSTGGLIAVMLGRLRMSVDTTLREYRDITSQVYQNRRRTRMRMILDHVVPSGRRERKIALTIKDHLEPGNPDHRKAFKSDEIRCKTIVCSLQRSSSRGAMVPYLFRSYDSEQDLKHGRNTSDVPTNPYPITQIMLATSCSPYYFKPKKIGAYKYCDSGFSLTNPTYEVFQELNLRQDSDSASESHRPVSLVLSIGSGYDPADAKPDAERNVSEHNDRLNVTIQQLNRALSTVSEGVHSLMAEYTKTHDGYSYFRFNAKSNLFVPGRDHSLKREFDLLQKEIEDATLEYLKTPKVVENLEECARKLIQIRRLRSSTNRWETFAFGSRYRCKHAGDCDRKASLFSSRDELIDHLRNVHKMPPADAVHGPEIKTLLDKGRTNSD